MLALKKRRRRVSPRLEDRVERDRMQFLSRVFGGFVPALGIPLGSQAHACVRVYAAVGGCVWGERRLFPGA